MSNPVRFLVLPLACAFSMVGHGFVTTNEIVIVEKMAEGSLRGGSSLTTIFGRTVQTLAWSPEHTAEILEAVFRTNVVNIPLPPPDDYRYPMTNQALAKALRHCDCAMFLLANYGTTNSPTFLRDVICDTNYTRWHWDAAYAYICRTAFSRPEALWVVSHSSELDCNLSPFLNGILYRSTSQALSPVQSNAVRNILLVMANSAAGDTMFLDKACVDAIPGYASSSNRLALSNRVLSGPESVATTNYFAPIQAQLNAATNLVELSTNDFLNAGE